MDCAFVLALSLLVLLPVHGPLLVEPLLHYPDVVTAFTLGELAEPGRYTGDPLREIALPWGYPVLYKAVLWPFVQLLPVLLSMKLLSVLASLLLPQIMLWGPGERAQRLGTAGAALSLALVLDSLHGFFPRALGLLLTAGLLVALQKGRLVWAAGIAAVSPWAYPMVFPPAAAAVGLLTLRRVRTLGAARVVAITALLLGSLGISLWRSGRMADAVGPPCTATSCPDMPELGVAGNYTHSSVQGLADTLLNFGEHTPAWPAVLALFAVSTVIGLRARSRHGLQGATALLLGSVAAWLAITALTAWKPMPTGYASRAFVFSLPLLGAWTFGLAVQRAHDVLAPRGRARAALAGMVLPPALALLLLDPVDYTEDQRHLAPVVDAIRQLPDDVLLGGHPVTLDPLPLLTSRRAVVIAEVFNPWMGDWWRAWKERLWADLEAFYSPDQVEVRAWCAQAGVTHLVVEGDRFAPDLATAPQKFDWEPMASQVKERAARGDAALGRLARPGEICLLPCQGDWQADRQCWLVVH